MTAQEIAAQAAENIQNEAWGPYETEGEVVTVAYRTVYVGSFMSLDPCGKYHHVISPNGITDECERFWEELEAELDNRGLSLECGEGDPTDIFATEYRTGDEG